MLLAALLVGCTAQPQAPAATPAPAVLAERVVPPAVVPAVATREAVIAESLAAPTPLIVQIPLDDEQRAALAVALADQRVAASLRQEETGAPLRNELFGVHPVGAAEITPATSLCERARCLRVDIYHFARNSSTLVTVDLDVSAVLDVQSIAQTAPDVPQHLAALAVQIAVNSREVADVLGYLPSQDQASMANVKTAMVATRCERSQHLCVAPTFLDPPQPPHRRAVWAIVDLTDNVLVGVQETALGASGPPTELTMQDSVILARYCDAPTPLSRDGWELEYLLTGSDGLRATNIRFNGMAVISSTKLVDWHVAYGPSASASKGFGYSDAVGCPAFSAAAVPAYDPPQVIDITAADGTPGFALVQSFRHPSWPQPCSYHYQQRIELYQDGRLRIVAASLGRGCGDNGTYRPVLRIVPAGPLALAEWRDGGWAAVEREQWWRQGDDTPFSPAGGQLRLSRPDGGGFEIAPSRPSDGAESLDDRAFVYVTRYNPAEGEGDMLTLGPCCNVDFQQGPELFIGESPEPLDGGPLTIWYVPQLDNSAAPGAERCWADAVLVDGVPRPRAWPCVAGPWFVPSAGT